MDWYSVLKSSFSRETNFSLSMSLLASRSALPKSSRIPSLPSERRVESFRDQLAMATKSGARPPERCHRRKAARWWGMDSVYEAAGGDAGLLRLASAWHRRVMADEVVEHAFSHGFHPQHTERLAAYWAEALGGPTDYSDNFGDETSVVRLHSGNGEHDEMDRRAIACFDEALDDVGITDDDPLHRVLSD